MSKKNKRVPDSFIIGALALSFLVIGYQTAVFVHRAAVEHVVANADSPDTVYIVQKIVEPEPEKSGGRKTASASNRKQTSKASGRVTIQSDTIRKNASHSAVARQMRKASKPEPEAFRFNPNTVSQDELERLGFSGKQAASIISYREKGGHFARKSDFAKSFVVSDEAYRRLEAYIDIPKLDINEADSAAFDALPGIGPFFAAKMVDMRTKLGGYATTEQLMDIWRFDEDRYKGIADLIIVGHPYETRLWTMSEADLSRHPYLNARSAHSIVLFRNNHDPADWTIEKLAEAGILSPESASKLSKCIISAKP